MRVFDTFSEAFDYVRERNKPTRVVIREPHPGGTIWKLFPSGKAEQERPAEGCNRCSGPPCDCHLIPQGSLDA
jgi:hypothetical protein